MDFDGESTLSTFTASDGDNLAVQDWPLPEDQPARGVVLLVHGLGEHAGRYERVARRLNTWGFAVRGYDQYGHGESDGVRGALPTGDRLLADLADIVDSTRVRMSPDMPLVLLGHSMGGLVAALFVARRIRPVDALVLSSPALDAGFTPLQKFLLGVLPRFAPELRLGNGLDVRKLSHDPEVIAAYRADPRVHDRISARLAAFIAHAGPEVLAHAASWSVPTLLLYAGADALVSPAGSRAFTRAAPRGVVNSLCFESLYHEIFNEPDPEPVFAALQRWLDARVESAATAA